MKHGEPKQDVKLAATKDAAKVGEPAQDAQDSSDKDTP
jgi:hypothetical protein